MGWATMGFQHALRPEAQRLSLEHTDLLLGGEAVTCEPSSEGGSGGKAVFETKPNALIAPEKGT